MYSVVITFEVKQMNYYFRLETNRTLRNQHITIQKWAFLQEQTEQITGLQEHMRDYGTNSRDYGTNSQDYGTGNQQHSTSQEWTFLKKQVIMFF